MPLKSTSSRYGSVAVVVHWLSAVLIIAVLGSGFRASYSLEPVAKEQLLGVHASLAIIVTFLTIGRLLWWMFVDRKPGSAEGTPKWQERSATAVHWLFYIVIFGMAVSGIGMFMLSGAGPIVFGLADGPLPDFWNFEPRAPHWIGARAMLLLLLLHIGAALHHHLIRRDDLLSRMWFGK